MTTVTLLPFKPNSVTVTMPCNILSISLLDIHTTTYFLRAHTMLEEHKPAIKEEADPDEL